MDIVSIILFLLFGAVAGWLAGKLMKGGGFGLIVNIIVGIIGSFIGGWLIIGACVLLFVVSLFKRK